MPIQFTCSACGVVFLRAPSYRAKYCSPACSHARKVPAVIVDDDGVTARIPLCRRDGSVRAYALIDVSDAFWASQWPWHFSGDGYARRTEGDGKETRHFLLHRELLGLVKGDGLEGDHRNLDKLDNRRANLRVLTHDKQMQNVPSQEGASSQYRGVSWRKDSQKWRACVQTADKYHSLGVFASEVEAAEAARLFRQTVLPFTGD
jgi:hypothetical protein